jgi:hypothetical protein
MGQYTVKLYKKKDNNQPAIWMSNFWKHNDTHENRDLMWLNVSGFTSYDYSNALLLEYNARLSLDMQTLIFNSKEDKLAFILKWS